ncbi:MAG: hypothetical protein RIF32_07445 [Leptospirales bacterium]|jgi:hypothetical protein
MNEAVIHTVGSGSRAFRGILFLAALQLIAVGLWFAFAQVAHYGYRNYFILMGLAWAGGAALTLVSAGWRWFWFALLVVIMPRLAGLVFQAPAHNVLFPWLAGLSLGLMLRLAFENLAGRRATASQNEAAEAAFWSGPAGTLAIFGVFLLFATVRAFFEAYSPYVLFGLPVLDLEMAPGVSANYGFHLSMLLILNLSGPLLFYFSDWIYTRVAVPRAGEAGGALKPTTLARIPRQLLAGLAGGALIHLCALQLQALGFEQLAAGAGDYWRQAGRLPGVLTDSGASTLMTPYLIASLVFAAYHVAVACIPGGERSSPLRRFVLPGGLAAVLTLAILFPLSYWHGRAFFLNLGGVCALAGMVGFAVYRRGAARAPSRRSAASDLRKRVALWIVCCALAVGAGFVLVWFYRTSDVPAMALLRLGVDQMLPGLARGEWFEAFKGLDPGRANYLKFGGRLFLESPWIGHGLNSFQVELTRFKAEAPTMLIDNPGSVPMGLLNDGGLLGAGLFAMLGLWILLGIARLWRTGDSVSLWLAGLPLAFAPAALLGYHLVFSEFAAVILIPFFLFSAGPARPLRTQAAYRIHWIAAALTVLWLAGGVMRFASTASGPELWRSSKTGRPQPALSP